MGQSYRLNMFWVIYRRVLLARYLKTCARLSCSSIISTHLFNEKLPMRFIARWKIGLILYEPNISSSSKFLNICKKVFFYRYWCCNIQYIVWRGSLVLISWLNIDEWQTLTFNRILHQKFAKEKSQCHRLSLANFNQNTRIPKDTSDGWKME